MSWSNALTKALFGWLIFLGIAYGVRTAGHLGWMPWCAWRRVPCSA